MKHAPHTFDGWRSSSRSPWSDSCCDSLLPASATAIVWPVPRNTCAPPNAIDTVYRWGKGRVCVCVCVFRVAGRSWLSPIASRHRPQLRHVSMAASVSSASAGTEGLVDSGERTMSREAEPRIGGERPDGEKVAEFYDVELTAQHVRDRGFKRVS